MIPIFLKLRLFKKTLLVTLRVKLCLKIISDKMLYLDATELLENPGMSLRRVANFAGVPPLINENNFFFDEEKGKNYYVTPRTIT